MDPVNCESLVGLDHQGLPTRWTPTHWPCGYIAPFKRTTLSFNETEISFNETEISFNETEISFNEIVFSLNYL